MSLRLYHVNKLETHHATQVLCYSVKKTDNIFFTREFMGPLYSALASKDRNQVRIQELETNMLLFPTNEVLARLLSGAVRSHGRIYKLSSRPRFDHKFSKVNSDLVKIFHPAEI